MLPIQITLEGFMSYRERVAFDFAGASLWMLCGDNGAGKSTVFDAMRWALFARHRGGAQGQEALIHHGASRLRVAFDLGLGEEKFRLLRTLSRGGRSTWQIEKLGENGPEKVPETDMRDGYEKWLREHIGLSDETFCAAMYLAQGRGDAILSARPEERHEMLAEIVDLSQFEALYERAKTRASELESEARAARLQWENAPDAAATEIADLESQQAEIQQQNERENTELEQLTAWKPWAAQWQALENERLKNRTESQNAEKLLGNAPQIERDYARDQTLQKLLPPLFSFCLHRERAAENARQKFVTAEALEIADEQVRAAELRVERSKNQQSTLESERRALESAQLEILARQNKIAPQLAAARQIETWRTEISALEAEIEAFPSALEAEISLLKQRIETAEQTALGAAILARFAREKATWRAAVVDEEIAKNRLLEIENVLPAAKLALESAQNAVRRAEESQTVAVEESASAQTRWADARAAIERFETVKGEVNCEFCGQKLTPQHAQRETARLEKALHIAQTSRDNANDQREQNAVVHGKALQELDAAHQNFRNLENEAHIGETSRQTAQNAREIAFENAACTLAELSPTFAARFDGIEALSGDPTRVLQALQSDFASPATLELLHRESADREVWRTQLQHLERQQTQQKELEARLLDRKNQLAPLELQFAPAILRQLRAEADALSLALEKAHPQLAAIEATLRAAQTEAQAAQRELEMARAEIARLDALAAGLAAAEIEIEAGLRAQIALAPDVLGSFVESDVDSLRAELETAKREKTALESSGLEARYEALRRAQTRARELESEATRIEKSLQLVPAGARRAPGELETEIEELRGRIEIGAARESELRLQIGQLQSARETKIRLEESLLKAQNSARQHKTLADLLGPHQLQRFLLREAENGIVDEANAVLDRISGGSLRLELRADDDEIAGARKSAPKVLDVAVFGSDGTAGMLPAFLSGSQRFRVAVALALGIGRYATRGGGTRLESVIIDEGFGSLDKIGRGEMIDELKALGDDLKRVILVSHQEEFAEAFSHRYLIEKEGGVSRARLLLS
jgi:DNA repair exonuclease SbcCD ATPase subunit